MKCLSPIDPLPHGYSTVTPLYQDEKRSHPWFSSSIINIWNRHNCVEDDMQHHFMDRGLGPINWVCSFLAQRVMYHDVLILGKRNGMLVPITSEHLCQLFYFRQLTGPFSVVPTPETRDFWEWEDLVEKSKFYARMHPRAQTVISETFNPPENNEIRHVLVDAFRKMGESGEK